MKKIFFTLFTISAFQASAQTPVLVDDIDPGSGGSQPWMTTVFNGKLYFSALTSSFGRELWSYDGANMPSLVYNLNPGSASSFLTGSNQKMADLNGKMYFAADNGATGDELAMYDGINPPSIVYDINAGNASSNPYSITAIGNKLYFCATIIANAELYVYDGTNPPTMFDINPGVQGSNPTDFTEMNGKVYFRANTIAEGTEIFMYDPATNNAGLAYEIVPGSTSGGVFGLIPFNNKIYFTATTAAYGRELYSYDGTTAVRLTDMNVGGGSSITGRVAAYHNQIYFAGSFSGTNYQLYKYNPTNSTTALVYNINPGNDAQIDNFIVYNDKLYFRASTPTYGNELWMHDGTSTSMVADINPGASHGYIRDLEVFNNKLYFTADNGTNGLEMFSLTDTALSVQNIKIEGNITAAPNPASGEVLLQLNLKNATVLNLQLTDLSGKLVWGGKSSNYSSGLNNISIPLNNYAPGTYFYRLSDKNGTLMFSGKIIRE